MNTKYSKTITKSITKSTLFINQIFTFMRKLSLVLVAMMAVSTAFAQISTGEINSSVIPRTGNRPQEGDFGMYIGASVTQIMDLVKLNQNKSAEFPDQVFWSLPAVNLKYYFTDNWEGRIGFQFGCQGATNKMRTKDYYYQHTRDINYTRFLPGVAYHFNTNNILDVYVGAQVPIGFNIDAEKTAVDNVSRLVKDNKFVIGGGIFLGLQVFIADLPFAIGIEGGYSGQANISGGRRTINNNAGEIQIDAALPDGKADSDILTASHLDARWGADAALTFTYYFRK